MKKVSVNKNDELKGSALDEVEVAAYLRENPKFFLNNDDVLGHMQAPERWAKDGVIDMQKFLLDRRSNEIDELRDCAQEVIETSRTNLSVQTRTHAAILALISAQDFNQLIEILVDDVSFFLDVDLLTIGFEPLDKKEPRLISENIKTLPHGTADFFIGPRQEIHLYSKFKDDGTFFGSGAGLIRSVALARIHSFRNLPVGILALGSRGSIFHSKQGTELINFLTRVVEALFHKHLEPIE